MSFFNRRRSLNHPQAPQVPFPFAPVENIYDSKSKQPTSSGNRKVSGPTRMMRRVSVLLTNRRKARPPDLRVMPFAIPSDLEQRWQAIGDNGSIADSDDSIDDIRRPSGLGRRASISSNRSLPPSPFLPTDKHSPFHLGRSSGYERTRALSSPSLFGSFPKLPSAKSDKSTPPALRNRVWPAAPIPIEVLTVILSFLPRSVVASLAPLSRRFCKAARTVLYRTLDLSTLKEQEQVESLVTLLASRRDLTDLVRTFECHTWPSFYLSQTSPDGLYRHISSITLTAAFTFAFQNMHALQALTLPSFDYPFLKHHSAFGLQRLTFLNDMLTAEESTKLFTWLDGQTNIAYLAFPNLADQHDAAAAIAQEAQEEHLLSSSLFLFPSPPGLSPTSAATFMSPPITPTSPFNSPTLLPMLTSLTATPSIVTSLLAPEPRSGVPRPRSVTSVCININTTLYSGLRPVTLMSSLQGVTHLGIRFGPAVDRRTIGKVLNTAGVTLTSPPPHDAPLSSSCSASVSSRSTWATEDHVEDSKCLRSLSIEFTDSTADAVLALYKIVNSVLPRCRGLISLHLKLSLSSGGRAAMLHADTPLSKLSPRDEAQVQLCLKSCPTLRSITLISGCRWTKS